MQFKISLLKLAAISLLLATSTAAHSFSLFRSEAWGDEPNTTRPIGDVGPGGATWSLVGENVSSSLIGLHGSASSTLLTDINADIINIVDNAFNTWANVSGFTNRGRQIDSNAAFGAPEFGTFGNIRIAAINFDGQLGFLGHAFSVDSSNSINGDIHLDDSENWNDRNGTGINVIDLASVLLQEIGHALGLGHTDPMEDPFSVLNPTIRTNQIRTSLTSDDIAGIQAIYGAPISAPNVVPLPGAPILFLSAMGLIGLIKRKRAILNSAGFRL